MTDSLQPGLAARLRALTPARVGLARTGASLETADLLDFQRCHAQARDAVNARLDSAALAAEIESSIRPEVLRLHSSAFTRAEYLQRPDLGRKLNEASRALLADQPTDEVDLALVMELIPRLSDWWLAPFCIVEQARVAIGDEIGKALNATISIVLIGERPGLSSPDSLGAYITWQPRPGRTDSERNCISNIRAEGLSYPQAAAQLSYYLHEARRLQLTGIALKEASPSLKLANAQEGKHQ